MPNSIGRSWMRWIQRARDPQSKFVQPRAPKSEAAPKRRCTRVMVQPPGKDGRQDIRKLWMLKDTGAEISLMHKDLCDDIYGVDQFHYYEEPRVVSGIGGNAVQSLGRRHIYLSFEDSDDVYTAEVEIVPDSPGDNFDILLCEKFFVDYDLVKWSKRIGGRVNYVFQSKRLSNPPPAFFTDAHENMMNKI